MCSFSWVASPPRSPNTWCRASRGPRWRHRFRCRPLCAPDILGTAWAMMCPDERRQKGRTSPRDGRRSGHRARGRPRLPGRIARRVGPDLVGPFSRRGLALAGRGHDPVEIVRGMYGTDIDPCAARHRRQPPAVERGRGRLTVERVDVLERVPETLPVGVASLVVGNPPFLGQLTADTARNESEKRWPVASARCPRLCRRRRSRCSRLPAIRPRRHRCAPHARIVARGDGRHGRARGHRGRGSARGGLDRDGGAFDAAVDVVCPMSEQGVRRLGRRCTPTRWSSTLRTRAIPAGRRPGGGSRSTRGRAPGGGTLGQIAPITAGFRQHFYGCILWSTRPANRPH